MHPGQTIRHGRHARHRLEWIARRDKEPHLIQLQFPQRAAGKLDMALMHRIERSAQQAHPHPAPVPMGRKRIHPAVTHPDQVRTCPVPITS